MGSHQVRVSATGRLRARLVPIFAMICLSAGSIALGMHRHCACLGAWLSPGGTHATDVTTIGRHWLRDCEL